MNKCSNCQAEFDGESCPSCEGKLSKKGLKLTNNIYNALKLAPLVMFAGFVVLMIVFILSLPVARVNAFGLSEKYGSIWSGTKFDEIVGLNSLSIAIMIVALLSIIHIIGLLPNRFSEAKYRKVCGIQLTKILDVISMIFALIHLGLAIGVIGKINAADGGLGIIKVSSYAILTIILSIICLLVIASSMVLCRMHEKANPEILENWELERQKVREASKGSSIVKKEVNREGKKLAKFLLIPVILLPMILMSNKAQIGDITTRFKDDSFDAGDLKKILAKDAGKLELTKFSIETEVGKSYVPEGASEDNTNAVYYTDNYLDLLGKMERNEKYGVLAIEQGDERISALLKQAKDLEEEQETLVYGKAEITYSNNGYVTEVVYDNVVIDNFSSIEKKLDKVEIYKVWETYADQEQTTKRIQRITYMATYADGSYIYGISENVLVVLDDETTSTTYEGSYVGKTFKWQDQFGKYEVEVSEIKN